MNKIVCKFQSDQTYNNRDECNNPESTSRRAVNAEVTNITLDTFSDYFLDQPIGDTSVNGLIQKSTKKNMIEYKSPNQFSRIHEEHKYSNYYVNKKIYPEN